VHPAHRAVFKALRALVEAQVEVNSLTLKDALDQAGDLSRVGGYTGLVELLSAEEVGRPVVLADLLVRKRKLRQLIRLGAQLVRQAAEEEAPRTPWWSRPAWTCSGWPRAATAGAWSTSATWPTRPWGRCWTGWKAGAPPGSRWASAAWTTSPRASSPAT